MTIHNIPAIRTESCSRKLTQGLEVITINHRAGRNSAFALAGVLGMMCLLLLAGCTCGRDIRHAKAVAEVDNAQKGGAQGFVEFTSTHHNAPVPIFLVDDPERPELLGAIGINRRDKYSYSRHGAVMAEKLRVALPPGDHTFVIEYEGDPLKVTVADGQVTPVEIDYVLLDSGDVFAVYRLGTRVASPTAKQTAMAQSAPK